MTNILSTIEIIESVVDIPTDTRDRLLDYFRDPVENIAKISDTDLATLDYNLTQIKNTWVHSSVSKLISTIRTYQNFDPNYNKSQADVTVEDFEEVGFHQLNYLKMEVNL